MFVREWLGVRERFCEGYTVIANVFTRSLLSARHIGDLRRRRSCRRCGINDVITRVLSVALQKWCGCAPGIDHLAFKKSTGTVTFAGVVVKFEVKLNRIVLAYFPVPNLLCNYFAHLQQHKCFQKRNYAGHRLSFARSIVHDAVRLFFRRSRSSDVDQKTKFHDLRGYPGKECNLSTCVISFRELYSIRPR